MKRLAKFAKLEIVEVDEAKSSLNPTEGEIRRILGDRRRTLCLRACRAIAAAIALAIEGDSLTSEALSGVIDKISTYQSLASGHGSSAGRMACLLPSRRAASASAVSQNWTFPHQLMRFDFVRAIVSRLFHPESFQSYSQINKRHESLRYRAVLILAALI
ncbi:MAG: 23S rRNA (pseudouridine(1915)-N(3))-methyltransferase RlmH [Bacillus subtilis]|nr:23S rRNA (pseudouridine(1915)-N(3))-methyltransferase RlmH [Bacillus subtilis]